MGKAKEKDEAHGLGNDALDKAKNYVRRIESLNDDLATAKGEYMNEAKGLREDVKTVLQEAKDNGIPPKAVKAVVRTRELERKISGVRGDLDLDIGAVYEQLHESFASTPLGQAAGGNVVTHPASAGSA